MTRWPDSGPPGTLCMATKVAVAMNQTVMTPCRSRLRVYCHIILSSLLLHFLRFYPCLCVVGFCPETTTQHALDALINGIDPTAFIVADEGRVVMDDLLGRGEGLHAHLWIERG